jgi:hypothetical protein
VIRLLILSNIYIIIILATPFQASYAYRNWWDASYIYLYIYYICSYNHYHTITLTYIYTIIILATPFQASYAYRNWWDASGNPSTNKVLQELVRKAAAKCEFDDVQTAKLLGTSNPITDSESGRKLQVNLYIHIYMYKRT